MVNKFVVKWASSVVMLLMLVVLAGFPTKALSSVCPAVGRDSDCGAIITITDNGASVSFTGQGPYDGIDDTLVGVVNKSSRPVRSVGLRSLLAIFAFDGDGICGLDPYTGQAYSPVPSGCPFGPTTYEGPGVSFNNINFDLTSGIVNFATPIATGGGTAYFSLEDAINSAYSCADVINGAVKPIASGANIDATFTPNFGLTLQQAAQFCGFVNFDWVQAVTRQNDPSEFWARNIGGAFDPSVNGPVRLTSSRTPYSDPPQGGGYRDDKLDYSYPFYYNISGELATHESDGYTLTFHDAPADGCLPGGDDVGTSACDNTSEPAGSYGGYTTHLAGVNSDGTATDLNIGFTWTSNNNGTTGGVHVKKTDLPADGNGTGGVTITSVQETTDYNYNGIAVTTVNGQPVGGGGGGTGSDATPPIIMVAANPAMLWPPNGKMISVTISGTITDNEPGGTGVNASTASYVVTDKYGKIQPHGTVILDPNGNYSFIIQLQASRNGGDKDGRQYLITVSAQDNAGNSGRSTASVIVPHDQRR